MQIYTTRGWWLLLVAFWKDLGHHCCASYIRCTFYLYPSRITCSSRTVCPFHPTRRTTQSNDMTGPHCIFVSPDLDDDNDNNNDNNKGNDNNKFHNNNNNSNNTNDDDGYADVNDNGDNNNDDDIDREKGAWETRKQSCLVGLCPFLLTHWGRDKMDAFSHRTHSNAFSLIDMLEFRLLFPWSLFLRV